MNFCICWRRINFNIYSQFSAPMNVACPLQNSWIVLWWMNESREFLNVTFGLMRPNRQAWTTVMRWMTLVAKMKLLSYMAAPGIEPSPEVRSWGCWPLSYSPTLTPQDPEWVANKSTYITYLLSFQKECRIHFFSWMSEHDVTFCSQNLIGCPDLCKFCFCWRWFETV